MKKNRRNKKLVDKRKKSRCNDENENESQNLHSMNPCNECKQMVKGGNKGQNESKSLNSSKKKKQVVTNAKFVEGKNVVEMETRS